MGTLLDDSELPIFDTIASELTELTGSDINYYGADTANSTVDPLYGEPSHRVFIGPLRMVALFQWPQIVPTATEQGYGREWDGLATIARVQFDSIAAPYPFDGDVIEAWRTPFHDANSMGKGMYFSVTKVENDGHVNDSPSFVQFKLTLKRRSQFGEERLILPP